MYTMEHPGLTVLNLMGNAIGTKKVIRTSTDKTCFISTFIA